MISQHYTANTDQFLVSSNMSRSPAPDDDGDDYGEDEVEEYIKSLEEENRRLKRAVGSGRRTSALESGDTADEALREMYAKNSQLENDIQMERAKLRDIKDEVGTLFGVWVRQGYLSSSKEGREIFVIVHCR